MLINEANFMRENIKKLFKAIQDNNLTEVKRLVEIEKVDVNTVDCYRRTPLHKVAEHGHTDIVKFLINHKAN
ncbi:ankyrin repeat domain-containing protein, partial [Wolbachia endosymbiont of Pentidionis agamae]|uniref:ankyrin repeat domain-containing protein n=1 Tax=Wolbachia endosymbiont of Pentidionis agamae TaxID=3110435 RepID=UPI002FD40F18